MVQCPEGHQNPPDTAACLQCGAWLDDEAAEQAARPTTVLPPSSRPQVGPPPAGPSGPRGWTDPQPGYQAYDDGPDDAGYDAGASVPDAGRRGMPAWLGYAALFLAVTSLAAAVTLYVLRPGGPGAPSPTSTPAPVSSSAPPGPPPVLEQDIKPGGAKASATSKPAPDGCDKTVNYDAANLYDGDIGTAWRADKDGAGVTIDLDLPSPRVVTKVGLIPGYVKRDPCSGDDRWPQMRRIKQVTWTFDDGGSVTHKLNDHQSRQTISTNQTKPTRKVKLRIDATYGPGDAGLDFTPISELYLSGSAVSAP